MRKLVLIVFSLCSLLSVSCGITERRKNDARVETKYIPSAARAGESLRKRILVLPFFDVQAGRSVRTAEAARSAFIASLISSNRVVVVSPADLGKDLSQFKKDMGYDLEAISKIAGPNDISAIIEGSVLDLKASKIGDEVGFFRKITARVTANVQIRVYSTKTNRQIFNDVRMASVESTIRVTGEREVGSARLEENPSLVRAAISKALNGTQNGILRSMDKIAWEGRIALIRGDRIYVNAGRLSGIQVGDILRISSEGEEIYDPENGVFIGRAPGRPKGTVEVVSYFGKDGAVAIIHSGGGFEQNDRVNLY
ncbi:MAG: hypothetical protein VX583_10420 [Bdellovibrionota bacterium]